MVSAHMEYHLVANNLQDFSNLHTVYVILQKQLF